MNPFENLERIKQEYESELLTYGDAMVFIDNYNNIMYANSTFSKEFGVGDGELKGSTWTTVTKAFEYKEGVEIPSDARPSEAAVLTNVITVDKFYLTIRDNPKLFLVTLTAVPFVLNGEVAGGILILKPQGK